MTLVYFLLLMIPIVVIHELGHYWVGRWSGIRAEVFSVGFGPELYKMTDKHGTIWRFAAIPLGGYVRFAKDANGTGFPSMETDKPRYLASYRGKMATILAGPVANFIFSLIIFFIFATAYGLQSDRPVIDRTQFVETELQSGDAIVGYDGQTIDTFSQLETLTANAPAQIDVVVSRNGENQMQTIWNPNALVVGFVDPSAPAWSAGIKPGDVMTSYAGTPIENVTQLVAAIQSAGEGAHSVGIIREAEPLTLTVAPAFSDDGVLRIGVGYGQIYVTAPERLGAGDAANYSLSATTFVLTASWDGIRDLVTGRVPLDAMSGPVGIARVSSDAANDGFWNFIWLMGMMSSAIGFLNLLPIPILDGGHLVFLTYERVFGKLPPQKLLNGLFMLGMVLLLGVMLMTTTREIFG